jgi:SsrA-binding protein
MSDKKPGRRSISLNRRAEFEFELETKFEAGMVLTGSEVKSMRAGKVTLDGSWVEFHQGRPVLQGAHIAIFLQANRYNHEPARPRPLLLHWMESQKLHQLVKEKGVTLVPLELYFKGPWVKLSFAVGRGRKVHDKRHALREKDDKREVARELKERR